MNEASSAILKIITALTSPKASIKFISIAISLVISWRFFNEVLTAIQVPEEHRGIVFLFISMGAGALAGELIYTLIRIAYERTIGKYKAAKEHQQFKQKQREQEQRILNNFTVTYRSFDKHTKRLLWSLSEDVQCLWDHSESDNNIPTLIENGYIKRISLVSEHSSIYKLHPALAKYLKTQIPNEIEKAFTEFDLDNASAKDDFLMLVSGNLGIQELLSRTKDIINFCKRHGEITEYSPHYKDKEGESFSSYLAGYHVSIDKFYTSKLEEKYDTKIIGEVFIPIDELRA